MATATYKTDGSSIAFVATAAQSSGDVVIVGDLIGVVQRDVASGETGSLAVEGCFDLPTGGAVIATGKLVYWVTATSVITETALGNTKIGYLTLATAATDTVGRVKLSR